MQSHTTSTPLVGNQCALAHSDCGQWLVFLAHVRGQNTVVGKLWAALEHGDTAYQNIYLFRTGRDLTKLHSDIKADASVQADKNTHMWRNYHNQVLSANRWGARPAAAAAFM